MDALRPAVERLAALDAGAVDRPDAQAWILLGLRAAGRAEAVAHASRLARFQLKDGSLPVRADLPQAHWPTAIAALAWAGLGGEFAGRAEDAVGFLCGVSGKHWEVDDDFGHDPSIVGWSWISDTHSWVEPTSLAILAVDRAGAPGGLQGRAEERVESAVRMILDRQLPDGGWNYGNTVVLGNTLKPLPEETAFCLCALRGRAVESDIAKSVAYLVGELSHVRSPATLAWTLMTLAAWGRDVEAEAPVRECLAVQEAIGEYPPDMLAQLIVAVEKPALILGETER